MSRKRTVLSIAVVFVVAGIILGVPHGRALADAQDNPNNSRIERGFAIAPVPLNLDGKNRALVGLGSYLVNAVASCNGCHSAGPATKYVAGGNPYFGQPAITNPATYLSGGRDFGALVPNTPHTKQFEWETFEKTIASLKEKAS